GGGRITARSPRTDDRRRGRCRCFVHRVTHREGPVSATHGTGVSVTVNFSSYSVSPAEVNGVGEDRPSGPLDAGVSAGRAHPSASRTVRADASHWVVFVLRPPSGVSQGMFSLLSHSPPTAEEAPESPSEGATPMKRSRIVIVAATGAICALGGAA